jgi:2-polyprenyl-3-methyl-5-hydroxy-6-metoxy-1,4-benzoquinol methylase
MPLIERERWDLRECSACGQRWHGRILSPHWNDIRFSKWMSGEAIRQFEAEHGGNQDVTRDVQHVLRLKDLGVTRILDFGCGLVEFLAMARLFGIEAVGVDRSIGRRSGAGVQVYAEFDEAPGQFDAITMFEVLEHLDYPLAILLSLKSRLKPRRNDDCRSS